MHGDDIRKRGHAWVTRNDKDLFITPAYRSHTMKKIGENGKYRYWVSSKQRLLKRTKISQKE